MAELRVVGNGDGGADDTPALKAAIAEVHAQGGGRVVLTSGRAYRAGTFALLSGVELHLESGSRLLASPDPKDFEGRFDPLGWVAERHTMAMIVAEDVENVAITGLGTIDGNARAFLERDRGTIYWMRPARPYPVFLHGARDVTVRDVRFADAAAPTLRLSGCDEVSISGVRILNDLKVPNSDGIVIDRGRNVRISGVHVEGGGDGIAIKGMRDYERYGSTDGVVVTGCTIVSTSSALGIGCETSTGIRNVLFDGCIVRQSHRGLAVQLGEEGDVENVVFSNMVVETRLFDDAWMGRGEPIAVKVLPPTSLSRPGRLRNVVFRNVLARSENGVYVEGEQPDRIEGIQFESVDLTIAKTSRWPGGRVDRRPCTTDGIRPHPTSGFMIEKASDVTLRNCSVRWEGHAPEYFAHALETDDVQNLTIDQLDGTSAFPSRLAARHLRATSVRVLR